jgi:hypothetical protein
MINLKDYDCPSSEYSEDFLQGMVSRMTVSYHKYGKVKDAYPHDMGALKSLQQRIDKYLETGNTEWLIDVANFAMIEFMCPSVEDAHFRGTDSDESPGRTTKTGHITQARNGSKDTWL